MNGVFPDSKACLLPIFCRLKNCLLLFWSVFQFAFAHENASGKEIKTICDGS